MKIFELTKREWAWSMYDFANSAYALIVLSLFFPLFFAKYVAIGEQTAALWGVSVAISILLAGLVSPILGAYTDKLAQRKRYFIVLSLLSIIGTMLLYTTAQMSLFYGILFFIIVNTVFGSSSSETV